MADAVPYDAFADIYDAWVDSAPEVTERNRDFYVEEYLATSGPVAELGVGNGRILVEAARAGRTLYGVDSSRAMLDLCRRRAREAGVGDRVRLIEGDFRDFQLPEPAALVTIPFHSIGHLLTPEDRAACLRQVRSQLVPGGRLVLDHFVYDPEIAARHAGNATLRADYTDPDTGRGVLLWITTRLDMERRIIHVITWTDETDGDGVVVRRKVRRMDLGWLEPEETRALLEAAGFTIDACYGDFDRTPFDDTATHQIWSAHGSGFFPSLFAP